MGSFQIPKIPQSTNKSVRFPNDLIEARSTREQAAKERSRQANQEMPKSISVWQDVAVT